MNIKTDYKGRSIEFDTLFPSYPEGTLWIAGELVCEGLYANELDDAVAEARLIIDDRDQDSVVNEIY